MKKVLLAVAIVVVAVGALVGAYLKWAAPTRVAFANYPDYVLAPLLDFEPSSFIKAEPLRWSEKAGKELYDYDAVFFFGMGLKFTPEQETILEDLMKRGVPVYVTASTRSETALTSLTDEQNAAIRDYLGQGGTENTRRLLNYARYELDGKRLFVDKPEPPERVPRYRFFHTAGKGFETLDQYFEFLRSRPGYDENAPLTLIFSGNGGAFDLLIESLEKRGVNVIAASGMFGAAATIREIMPDAVVYSPHGRLSGSTPDEITNLLTELNIPLFCPIKVNQLYEEFLTDQRGMTGGMLSQSVTMPELDGGVAPFVLSALYLNNRGLQEHRIIPGRADRYADLIHKTITLQRKPNAEKKLVIIYYKGAGQSELAAGSMEVGDSLLNTLRNLRDAGYNTGELPENTEQLLDDIQGNAAVFGTYAEGAIEKFLATARVEHVPVETYVEWVQKALPEDLFKQVTEQHGDATTGYFSTINDGRPTIALGMLRFGNIVVMPQTMPGLGGDANALIHGNVKQAPPHSYLATYLWIRYGFEADAMMHFGTHGSLEFTPWKDVALSDYDWPDILVGSMPHYYLYVINNVGEALIAKRRSYATMVSHLTPPFMSSDLYGPIQALEEKLHDRENAEDLMLKSQYNQSIIDLVVQEKMLDELRLSETFTTAPTEEDMRKIHNYVHELEETKINRGLYVIGRPYTDEEADETALLMTVDHLAAARFDADVEAGKVKRDFRADLLNYTNAYLEPARTDIKNVLATLQSQEAPADHPVIDADAPMTRADVEKMFNGNVPPAMAEAMKDMSDDEIATMAKAMMARQPAPDTLKMGGADAVLIARKALLESTQAELDSMINAFNGGYLAPSPGGDPVGNPATVPTGRNLYGIDPERTPTRESYAVGCQLGEALIAEKLATTGKYPQKVAFTLWGGEFLRTQGTNIGEIFFLLGVEPVWDSRGRVADVRLIPLHEVGRPRIDVVVQTSGQFRGAGSSRLNLIDKAIRLANEDTAGEYDNYVKEGSLAAIRVLVDSGMSPKDAKELSTARIFGGVNGNFGTGITGMVQAGDRWEDSKEISDRYLRNMGAIYTGDRWGEYHEELFRAALQNTDTIVHSRSSNSWGPLSLDHVYEFMGGMNLAIKNVTGNEPDAYFNDLRTPGRARIQEAGQAVMAEARTTLLNPKYITEMMEEGPTAAGTFAEAFRNTYGWEVMKPDLIKDHLWEEYKRVYIDDDLQLGMRAYFEEKNPAALQEMTGVMLETIRKGMWEADDATIKELVNLHVELIRDHNPACTGFVCNNEKLRDMIAENITAEDMKEAYQAAIRGIRERGPGEPRDEANTEDVTGMTLKENTIKEPENLAELIRDNATALTVIGGLIVLALAALMVGARKRKSEE